MRCFLLLAIAFAAGCTTIAIGGGPVRTDGTVAVSEHKSGTKGVSLELGGGVADLSGGAAEVGVYMTADVAGYTDNGDGDLITWAGLSVRYRRYLATGILSPYFALGGGPGVGGGYSDENLVLEAHAELGLRVALGAHAAVTLNVRERPAIFISGERWTADPLNTLSAGIGLEIRLGGQPAKRRASETQIVRRLPAG